MQSAGQLKKQQLWDKLEPIFQGYAEEGQQIPTDRVEDFVRKVLKQTTPQQVHYVVRNMFRVDGDGSGKVSRQQLGNFLFRAHCGQMSLQKAHRQGKIARGKERMINAAQFHTLINNAVSFLGVTIDQDSSFSLFKKADKDCDDHITYVQYFRVIDETFCKQVKPVPPPPPSQKPWKSKLRHYLRVELRRLYDRYVVGHRLEELLGVLSQSDQATFSSALNLIKNDVDSFEPFFNQFLKCLARKGLALFHEHRTGHQRSLDYKQFQILLRRSFGLLNIHRTKVDFRKNLFDLIDKNKSGTISYREYLDWVENYLCADQINQQLYYLKDDDESYARNSVLNPIWQDYIFRFHSNDFSKLVDQRFLDLVSPFDKNNNQALDQGEIKEALNKVLNSDAQEIDYAVKNMHRVDKNNDKRVTFIEFANFCSERHFGQIAIQRLHMEKSYLRHEWRMMNYDEFHRTLSYALKHIGIDPPQETTQRLFQTLDVDHCGWILYEIYFYFLMTYFGSLKPNEDEQKKWWDSLQNLSALDRFTRIYFDQLTNGLKPFDDNKNNNYQIEEVTLLLKTYFGFDRNTLQDISRQIFTYNGKITLDTLIRIILESYLVKYGWLLKNNNPDIRTWGDLKINLDQFTQLFLGNSFFLRRLPSKQDLAQIFKLIGNGKEWITLRQLVDFISKYLGIGLFPVPVPDEKPEEALVSYICDELEALFRAYDKDKSDFLDRKQLESFMIQVLQVSTSFEHNYIFRNFCYKVDKNNDSKVTFNQFAPFALFYAGQHSLRDFHIWQPNGKRTLTLKQLNHVLRRAFKFLKSFDKCDEAIQALYKKIGQGTDPSYLSYFTWLQYDLARRYNERKKK